MKKNFKKLISLVLCLCMILPSVAVTANADLFTLATERAVTPIISIGGDSLPIAYDNETKHFSIESTLNLLSDSGDGSIKEAAFNILYPFILEGIASGNWDNYYAAVEKELGDLFEGVRLDDNGDPTPGTGVPQEFKDAMAVSMKTDRQVNGTYGERDYTFSYDWRLDPMAIADELNEFIEGVKAATNSPQVSLSVRCLGCNVALAYIYKYGTESIKGLGIDVATSLGADFLSGVLSGDFGIDGNAIDRLIDDLRVFNKSDVDSLITSTIKMLENTGILDAVTDVARKEIYAKIEYGIISALAMGALMSFPGYWGMVGPDKFDDALVYVFGEEGSEKRERYAGLIEKITVFNNDVKAHATQVFKAAADNGINVGVISKYGTQMVPVLKKGDIIGDQYVSVEHSSFGATTSGSLYDTFSDEYIAERTALGLEKYISPDLQIDASTCLFPDSTWFFKGVGHGYYTTQECNILVRVMDADHQLTIDDFEWTQFVAYSYPERKAEPMTAENCHVENWNVNKVADQPEGKKQTLMSKLTAFLGWLIVVFTRIAQKLGLAK